MRPSNNIMRLGYALSIAGAVAFASIFLIVLLNGHWPYFLEPIRSRFALVTNMLGSFGFIIELAPFVGPGLLVVWLGEHIRDKS